MIGCTLAQRDAALGHVGFGVGGDTLAVWVVRVREHDLEMQVHAGGIAGHTGTSELLAHLHMVSGFHFRGTRRSVPVPVLHSVVALDDDAVTAGSSTRINDQHRAGSRRVKRGALRHASNVGTRMIRQISKRRTRNRVITQTKPGGDRADRRVSVLAIRRHTIHARALIFRLALLHQRVMARLTHHHHGRDHKDPEDRHHQCQKQATATHSTTATTLLLLPLLLRFTLRLSLRRLQLLNGTAAGTITHQVGFSLSPTPQHRGAIKAGGLKKKGAGRSGNSLL